MMGQLRHAERMAAVSVLGMLGRYRVMRQRTAAVSAAYGHCLNGYGRCLNGRPRVSCLIGRKRDTSIGRCFSTMTHSTLAAATAVRRR